MASERPAICVLCHNEAVLRQSHVVPEFCYKGMYCPRHRAVAFNPLAGGPGTVVQKGFRAPLLCQACEQLRNDRYEKPFRARWYGGGILEHLAAVKCDVIRGLDYATFKLFHLSVLFLATRGHPPVFAERSMPPQHEERIRRMLLECDPGEDWRYPVVATAIDDREGGILEGLVERQYPLRLHGHHGYMATYAGCHWTILTSGHACSQITALCLQPDGSLPIAVLPLQTPRYHRMVRACIRQSDLLPGLGCQ